MNKIYIFLVFVFASCAQDYTPKPRGFSRIDFPEKTYIDYSSNCPFKFQKPIYSSVENRGEYCWLNLQFESLNGTLHLSYKALDNDLFKYVEESRTLAYKHVMKADAISEQVFDNPDKSVYGLVYSFEGQSATPLQFYLTDSTSHFVRGALYFNTEMNDSIKPINLFVSKDVYHLIEQFQWQ